MTAIVNSYFIVNNQRIGGLAVFSTLYSVMMSLNTRKALICIWSKLCSKSFNSSPEMTVASAPTGKHFDGIFPPGAVEKRFMRSRGPGGQNVNMVNSKCEIRFNLKAAEWLSTELRTKFRVKFPRFVSEGGDVIVQSEKTRNQADNLDDCFTKLRQMLKECVDELEFTARPSSEEDLKILKERLDASARRRMEAKRRKSEKKKLRSHCGY